MSVNDFLNKHGWSMRGSVAQDGSARRYFRVEKDSSTAILMEVMGDTPGHRIEDFIAIGSWLNDIGLNAPKIYEAQNNLLLLEDFDDLSFKDALVGGEDAGTLYGLASDVCHTTHKRVESWHGRQGGALQYFAHFKNINAKALITLQFE